jgi:hypothetical protein
MEIRQLSTGKLLLDLPGRADLSGANLSRADLYRANLSGANLSGADLSGANLSGADLSGANLSGADLSGANLYRANLSGANLSGADLSGANLYRANLSGADLSEANLCRADLSETVLDPSLPCACSPALLAKHGLELRDGYVYGRRTKQSQHVSNTEYVPGVYEAPWFSVCPLTACHPGIYLASAHWLAGEYPGAGTVPCRAKYEDVHYAGGKFRARRLEILEG